MRPVMQYRLFWILKENKHHLNFIKVAIVSKEHVKKSAARKRKAESVDNDEQPRRSQVREFDFLHILC